MQTWGPRARQGLGERPRSRSPAGYALQDVELLLHRHVSQSVAFYNDTELGDALDWGEVKLQRNVGVCVCGCPPCFRWLSRKPVGNSHEDRLFPFSFTQKLYLTLNFAPFQPLLATREIWQQRAGANNPPKAGSASQIKFRFAAPEEEPFPWGQRRSTLEQSLREGRGGGKSHREAPSAPVHLSHVRGGRGKA